LTLPDGRALFRDLCLEIHPAQWIQVLGPSGCGKTTLLRLLVALERPEAGVIFWNGTPLTQVPGPVLRSSAVYVAQTPALVPGSVHHNLLLPFGLRAHATRPRPSREQIRNLLDRLGLEDVPLDRRVEDLSAGQRHRLALLRALLIEPRVLLLDEPMSALDRDSQKKVEVVLEEFRKANGTSLVLVSHQEAVHRSPDAVFRLQDGRLIPMGGA